MFRNRKLIFAVLVGVCAISVAMYLVLTKRGHKSEILADSGEESTKEELVLGEIASYSYDLETPSDLENYDAVTNILHLSGAKSCGLSESAEFSVTISRRLSSIPEFSKMKKAVFSFSCYSESEVKGAEVVLSIDDLSGKSVIWLNQKLEYKPGGWKSFNFEFDFKDLKFNGDNKLKVYIWNKSHEKFNIDDLTLSLEGLVSGKFHSKLYIPERNIEYDFETVFDGEDPNNYVSNVAHSGKFSYKLNKANNYSPSIAKRISEVIDSEFRLITMSCWLNQSTSDNEVLLVAAIKNPEGKEIFWQGRSTEKGKFPEGQWIKHRAQFKIPAEAMNSDNIVSVYAWNKGGSEVFVDDFLIVYGETNVRSGTNPALDMTTLGDSGLIFTENSKVLKTQYLLKYNLSAGDSLQKIIFSAGNKTQWSVSDNFITGNFLGGSDGSEQLARVTNEYIELSGFCEEQNRLQMKLFNYKNDIPSAPDNVVLRGDFYGSPSEEIVVLNLKKKKAVILGIKSSSDLCRQNQPVNDGIAGHSISLEDWKVMIPDGADVASVVYATSDRKSGLLFIDLDSGNYSIVTSDGSKFVSITKGNAPDALRIESKVSTASLNPVEQCDFSQNIFLLNYSIMEKRYSRLITYDFKSGKLSVLNEANDKAVESTMQLVSLANSDCLNRQYFSYDDSWKFSLVKVQFDGRKFSRISNIDFKGFNNGFNPKYYEVVRLFGMQLKKGVSGLLVICGNCNDLNYSGGFCSKTDTSTEWYPRIQYYYINEN